ncbi:MAG: SpoIIE family protein phosphatase, partial [Phycisphaerae bacterium]
RLLRLMASVIARRWKRQKLLRTRIAELATMYRLTAEFTGGRELQSVLDLVTRTVLELLGAKACAIRLLNSEQTELVVKSVANLSPEYLDKGPILLSESKIDREVVEEGKTVYVADEQTDGRVLYPAEAAREGIVSGLCAPLTYKGRCEGVIRVYMAERHEFDWYERSLLQAIAAQAAAAIVNARLYQEAVRGANLQRHVHMAAEVQRRMFLDDTPRLDGFDIHAVYAPCFELGGDFYDFHHFGSDNLGVAICDVAGKGLRASLLMASIRASLRAHAASIYDMSDVLARVNRDLCASTAVSDFATLFYGVIDAPRRRFTYANAGHIPPLLVRRGECRRLETTGGVIGIEPRFNWQQRTMTFSAGDVLVAFTDGLTDAPNFRDEPFGLQRVERAVLSAVEQGLDARGIGRGVLWEVRRFAGLQTRFDDLTLVAIKVL